MIYITIFIYLIISAELKWSDYNLSRAESERLINQLKQELSIDNNRYLYIGQRINFFSATGAFFAYFYHTLIVCSIQHVFVDLDLTMEVSPTFSCRDR